MGEMRVWLVTDSEGGAAAVFSGEEKAKTYAEGARVAWGAEYSIEAWDVDEYDGCTWGVSYNASVVLSTGEQVHPVPAMDHLWQRGEVATIFWMSGSIQQVVACSRLSYDHALELMQGYAVRWRENPPPGDYHEERVWHMEGR